MSKVVKMLAKISGTRNGVDWPDVGQTIELPDDEAAVIVETSKLAAYGKRDSNTFTAADHVDHSADAIASNAAIKANYEQAKAEAEAAGIETADAGDKGSPLTSKSKG